MRLFVAFLIFQELSTFLILYCLLEKIWKKRYLFPLTILFFGIVCALSVYVSIIDLFLLYIFFVFISYFAQDERDPIYSIFLVSLAFLVTLIIEQALSPLLLHILMLPRTPEIIAIIIFYILLKLSLILTANWMVQKWLLPQIVKNRKVKLVGCFFAFLSIAYLIYQIISYVMLFPEYSRFQYLLIMLVIILLLFVLVGGTAVNSLTKSQKLKFEYEKEKVEFDAMRIYARELDRQYQEMRRFRHDYINILSTLENFLREGKTEELTKYFYQEIAPTKNLFKNNLARLNDLNKIKLIELRGLIANKLSIALEKNIVTQIEIPEPVFETSQVNSLALVRIMGNILDNALEELVNLPDGLLQIALFSVESNTIIVVENTVRDGIEPYHILKEKSFSTKGEHRGLGLSSIEELVDKEENLLLETTIQNGRFTQVITVIEEDH